jgi:molybdopterin molybdotransferase
MLSVEEALARILAAIPVLGSETVELTAALGRVLAEPVIAGRDLPPWDNSSMDGYAVRSGDTAPAAPERPVRLRLLGEVPAGSVAERPVQAGEAYRILTGAPMPPGADTVVPQEEVGRDGDTVLLSRRVEARTFVRPRGEDIRAGDPVLAAGTVLGPPALGVLAALGKALVRVHQRPRVAILSTGDEVAEPGDERKPGQIFDSNRFSLHGLVEAAGGQATDHGIVPDLYDVLHAKLRAAAATADIVLTSGGVSVGDYDLVKAVLQDAGGIDFWQVAMQPGRPLAVGRIGAAHFFGLPGNPVASMLTFHLFVRPALWKLAGRSELFPPTFHAVAMEPMAKKAGRREFKRGILSYASTSAGGGRWEVRTTGPQGSGILTSMTLANCFVIIEEERGDVAAGDAVTVELFSAS